MWCSRGCLGPNARAGGRQPVEHVGGARRRGCAAGGVPGIFVRLLKGRWAAALVRRDGPKCLPAGERRGGERAPWGRSEERSGPSLGLVRSFRERFACFHSLAPFWIRQPCQRWCGQPHRPRHYGYAVIITEDAPAEAPPDQRPAPPAAGAWWWL